MFDLDYLAAFRPIDYYNQNHLDLVYSTLRSAIQHQIEFGSEFMILNWVFESASQLDRLATFLLPLGMAMTFVRLEVAQDEVERRIRLRNRENIEYQVKRSRQLTENLSSTRYGKSPEHVVFVTNRSIDDVAIEVAGLAGLTFSQAL